MRRKRSVSEEEQALWTSFVRGVKPLTFGGRSSGLPSEPRPPAPDRALPARRNAEGGLQPDQPMRGASVQPDLAAIRQTHIRSAAFMTAGEIAVANHLGGKAAKRKSANTPAQIGARQAGLDTGSWKRLSKGHTPVERKLDLHGMTAQAAFMRLHEFLFAAYSQGIRCVEIVTGLGSGPEGGVLRRELPFWLGRDDLGRMILAVTHTHEANRGAVRILIRKRRQPQSKGR
ncbi:Smr/MutS family protein [Acetobacter aceti]|uniref:DNA mismatch repair protein MutS n=1 Tax=Acetobacter aceti TaxID=435 RepID=A0A6S6PJU0_ACEAC|nr:Smr/MutS family protein [Acetobacter aceti]BCI66955.1 DNA mismatch repair protein MutS [Acetobacter aceti]